MAAPVATSLVPGVSLPPAARPTAASTRGLGLISLPGRRPRDHNEENGVCEDGDLRLQVNRSYKEVLVTTTTSVPERMQFWVWSKSKQSMTCQAVVDFVHEELGSARTSGSWLRMVSSSGSLRRSTPGSVQGGLMRPSRRAVTLDMVSAGVPGRLGFPPRFYG